MKKRVARKHKGKKADTVTARKKIIIGIVALVALITIIGSIGILMNKDTTSPSIDAAAPNPTTLESLDIKEYGLSLNYDARYGEATYAISDRALGDGTTVTSIAIRNDALKGTKDGCTGDTAPDYGLIGNIEILGASNDKTQYQADDVLTLDGRTFAFNYPKTNTPTDDACYDKGLDEKSGVQKQSLYDSFKALKVNTDAS